MVYGQDINKDMHHLSNLPSCNIHRHRDRSILHYSSNYESFFLPKEASIRINQHPGNVKPLKRNILNSH